MKLLLSIALAGGMAFFLVMRTDQPEYGAIFGRLTDDTGSPLPGATVTARNEARSLTFRAVTDLSGTYRLSSLPQGRYSVFAEAPKHHSRMLYGIIVNRAEEVQIDIVLPCCVVEPTATRSGPQ
jgi:hypothetical protein